MQITELVVSKWRFGRVCMVFLLYFDGGVCMFFCFILMGGCVRFVWWGGAVRFLKTLLSE